MEDVRENQMIERVAAFLRCLDSAGNSGVISLINLLTKVPYFHGIRLNIDANDLVDSGISYLNSNITNADDWSFLIVLKMSSDAIQFCLHNGAAFLRVRTLVNGTWVKWRTIQYMSDIL